MKAVFGGGLTGPCRRLCDLIGVPDCPQSDGRGGPVQRGILHRRDRHRMVLEGLERRRSVLGVDIPMTHRLGRGVIHLPLGLRLTDQPPERLYTYFRNKVAMLRLPHVPSAWKLRFIASLPARCLIYALRNGFARPAVSAIIFGLIDRIAHRLGPPAAGRQSRPLSSKLSDSHPNSPFFARRCAISP